MPLLEVRDLIVSYRVRSHNFAPKRTLYAVNGVSFDLDAGETLGLVGESGCGKSTLGKALVRLEKPASGSIKLEGRELATLSGAALRRSRGDIQMVFQDPYGSLNPRLRIADSLDEVLALCMKNDIHLMLVCTQIQDVSQWANFNDEFERSGPGPVTDQEISDFAAFWQTLARRYANIPNEYLSFNLYNEIHIETEEEYGFAWLLGSRA